MVAQEIDQLFTIKGIYVGDRVIRGPDWKWGDQDGGKQNNSNYPYLNGTIRGLSQWHPKDKDTLITNVIVVWDHGIYGNYRYNYRGAFDIRVTKRYEKLPLITVGNQVKRGQKLWRWNNQDGGIGKKGDIIEVYASPAPFEAGIRVAILWDKDKKEYKEKAKQLKLTKKLEEKNGF